MSDAPGLVHVGSVISEGTCSNGTLINGTAFLEFEGTCPVPSQGEVPTLQNVCCLEYTRSYKRSGSYTISCLIVIYNVDFVSNSSILLLH